MLISIVSVLLLSGCGVPDEFETPTPTPEQSPTPTTTREPTSTATLTSTSTPDPLPTASGTPPVVATATTASLNPTATNPAAPPTATAGPTSPPSTSEQIDQATTTAFAPGPGPVATIVINNPDATATGGAATIVSTIIVTPTATPTVVPTATPDPTPTPEPTLAPEPTATPELCTGAIPWYEAINNIGAYTTVIGPVVDATWAEEAQGKPTFLNLGLPYPDPARFTVLMWIPARWNFDFAPEEVYLGSTICVVGTIALYEGGAEMIIEGPEAIWVP